MQFPFGGAPSKLKIGAFYAREILSTVIIEYTMKKRGHHEASYQQLKLTNFVIKTWLPMHVSFPVCMTCLCYLEALHADWSIKMVDKPQVISVHKVPTL